MAGRDISLASPMAGSLLARDASLLQSHELFRLTLNGKILIISPNIHTITRTHGQA
jgi:hypothetical protein